MIPKYQGIAIGGPADRRTVNSNETAVEVFSFENDNRADDPVWYDYHNIDGVGVWFVRGAALADSLKVVLESYARPKDLGQVVSEAADRIASGGGGGEKATERSVIQSMSERIEELKANVSKANDENNELIYQQREVRRLCATAGVEDHGATVSGLVWRLIAQLNEARASAQSANAKVALREEDRRNFIASLWGAMTGEVLPVNLSPDSVSALEEESIIKVKRQIDVLGMVRLERDTAVAVIDETLAELKSTGHKHEGWPLSDLVDIAIDTERVRHSESLQKISDALNMSFAIMPIHSDTADAIVNVIRHRDKLHVPSQIAALEKRVTTLERKPLRHGEGELKHR